MKTLPIALFLFIMLSCSSNKHETIHLLHKQAYETKYEGQAIKVYTLGSVSKGGIITQISNFGGNMLTLWVTDKNGYFEDIVLGLPCIDDYFKLHERVFSDSILMDTKNINTDKQILIDSNAFLRLDKLVWAVKEVAEDRVELVYSSPDVEFSLIYTLEGKDKLKKDYRLQANRPTVVDIASRQMFNLLGQGKGNIGAHELMIDADSVWLDGKLCGVENTTFDFRTVRAIDEELKSLERRYNQSWMLNSDRITQSECVASVYEPRSGRLMEIFSDQQGLKFNSGDFIDGKLLGKYAEFIRYRESIALELLAHDRFSEVPTSYIYLAPNEVYTQTSIYKFSIK